MHEIPIQHHFSFSLDVSPGQGTCNIIIDTQETLSSDSGTTMTLLPEDFYNKLELTVSKAIILKRLTDKITFGSATRQPVSFPQTISGCGLNNSGEFYEEAAGMVGLGRGSESLISRMGSSIDGKFSYCLVDETKPNTTSKMNFGSLGIVSGFGTLSNPLFSGEPKSCYCLRLEAMSLGRTRLQYNTTSSFLIRCFTGTRRRQCYHRLQDYNDILPEDFYNKLESTVSKAIKLKRLTGEFFDLGLCYNTTSIIKAPIIIVHFNQENIKLKALNTLMRMSMDVRNFLMSYDLKKGTVSFKPTDCTKH
ncbi:unnamed protein product [Malus baccata var. baccata]